MQEEQQHCNPIRGPRLASNSKADVFQLDGSIVAACFHNLNPVIVALVAWPLSFMHCRGACMTFKAFGEHRRIVQKNATYVGSCMYVQDMESDLRWHICIVQSDFRWHTKRFSLVYKAILAGMQLMFTSAAFLSQILHFCVFRSPWS